MSQLEIPEIFLKAEVRLTPNGAIAAVFGALGEILIFSGASALRGHAGFY